MVGVYKSLTDFLPMLEEDKIGDWAIDRVNDGTPEHPIQMPFVNYSRLVREVEDAIYDFEQMHPEYGLNRYSSILEANGIEWGMDSMSAKDVSVLDGKCIMAMLMGAVRAERFCDGALLGFFKKGCIKKWLERLKEIDELESVRVRRESDYLFVIRDYLVEHGMKYDETIDNKVIARKNGKTYGFSEHLQAVVYSLLSAQRPWAEVVKHLDEIDGIFFGYDAKKILEQTDTYFVDRIREIKCGNRNIQDQMKYLPDNIATLRTIEVEYISLDAFVTSAPAHEIVKVLTDYKSKYKLRNMGEALCWEYLRNVGIDGAKPDVHLRRFLGSERMGTGNHETATVSEVIDTVRRLSKESGLSMAIIDNIIWSFCSEQYGEICGASPKCRECPVKEHCHKK